MLSNEQISKLKLNEQKEILSKRIERYQYLGLLDEYQLHPPSIINSFEYSKLNPYQHFLFKRVLHGLNVYKPEEVTNYTGIRKDALQKFGNVGKEKSMLGNKLFVIRELMLILGKHFLIAH